MTTNGGGNWTSVNTGLPDRWVTRVAADPYDESIAYVTFSGQRVSSPLPHVYRTNDYGSTWQSISSNLPEGPINDVIVDPMNPSVLYVGSDVGVYVSEDLGGSWAPLGTGLPITTVHDLTLHEPTRKLVAGTHGRSMFSCQLSAADTLHGVLVNALQDVDCVNASEAVAVFLLQNTGQVTDTFDVTVSGQLGWSLDPTSYSEELTAGQIDSSEIVVSVPHDAALWTVDEITFMATSRGNPFNVDEDSLAVTVYAIRGDATNDGTIDVADVILLINYLFMEGSPPEVFETADANCDTEIDVADIVLLINYLFLEGPSPCVP